MTVKRINKRLFRIAGIILGILIVLLTAFHFWFKAHAKGLIEDLVESKSHGKLKLKIGKFHFNYFNKNMELENAVFYTTDTATGSTAYRFSVEKIKLKAKAILPIVFKKRILIDSLNLIRPVIVVTRLRVIDKPDKKTKQDVSIPEEMGKVYSSIQDALVVLQVKRFQIDDGTFTLINKIDPGQLPMTVTNLHFHIDNLKVDSSKTRAQEKILFSDNIVLRSHDQNILFPDGRHRLSFSAFRINLEKKVVEFDSCTIAATRTDSSSASFDVFFDALFLTNIDFDTLYKSEVIKADSVYCVNPKFNLQVVTGKKKGSNKAPPKLEDIIQQLTGDLQLGYVIVTNADFNIKTIKDDHPSTFTFSNNNFEMQGLSIDQQAAKPIKVRSFAMAIRNYENFIKDSSYSIKFDSILFKDDQITLSNFLFNKLENGKIINSFSIPQFSLQGLSWDDLVFEKRLRAEQAIMFSPRISYTAPGKSKGKAGKQNLFQSLGAINEYMDLQYLDISNGSIDLKFRNNLRVQLQNANVSVQSNSLLTSTRLSGIKNSLTNLSFSNGIIHAGNMTIELNDIRYVGKSGQFGASSIHVNNHQKSIGINLKDVAVDKMQADEVSGNIFADGVSWQSGDIAVKTALSAGNKKADAPTIELLNVHGGNTPVHIIIGGKQVTTTLENISFTELVKKPGSKLKLEGLDITGRQLQLKDNNLHLSVAGYDITDNSKSSFRQLTYKNNTGKMEASVSIPSLTAIPHIQAILNGEIALEAMNISKPVVDIHLHSTKEPKQENTNNGSPIKISGIRMTQPVIHFTEEKDSGLLSLNWQGEKNASNFLEAKELNASTGKTLINGLNFYLTDFIFTNPGGKTFQTGEGKVSAQIKSIKLQQEEKQPLNWEAAITRFDARDFRLDSIGKANGNFVMKSGTVENLSVRSSTISNLRELVASNRSFQLKQFTGHYYDDNHKIGWSNAGYDRNNNTFSLDSFFFRPALEKDSFIAHQNFQTDYMTFQFGAASIGPVDLDALIKDNRIKIGTASFDKFLFADYKDKQLPFNPGIIKPLPVGLLKKISQQVSADLLQFTNAQVEYTETGEKTRKPGTIPITRMTVRIQNARNFNTGPADSLTMQATGYVMDSLWIRMKVKESYWDSLGGFLMTVQMKSADLTVLNTALVPLSSIMIQSGYLDTLSMRAVGREYLSLGEMKMFYHDLKVRVLKNGDTARRSLLTGLANLLIKNNNSSRTGNVFFIRKRDRSAINYLIKIAMSGISSSIGVKGNKKMIRKYKKELDERKLPPIDFD
ncbi:MAG: hypothetical protein ABIT05_06045 [Chitinophagaceae bacterium]